MAQLQTSDGRKLKAPALAAKCMRGKKITTANAMRSPTISEHHPCVLNHKALTQYESEYAEILI